MKICLFIASIVIAILAISSWPHYPPDWDATNFMLALGEYNIGIDQPHSPGYPLFVGMGRLIAPIVGNAYAYQMVNLLLLLSAGWALFFASARLGYPKVGLTATLLFWTHPIVSAVGAKQVSYLADAWAGCFLFFWASYATRWRPLGMASILLFLALIRPVSAAMLFPFAVGSECLLRQEKNEKTTFLTAILCMGAIAIGYMTTVVLGGGFGVYAEATDRVMGTAFRRVSLFGGGTFTAHLYMAVHYLSWLFFLTLPIIPFLFISRLWKERLSRAMVGTLLLWGVPAVLFYLSIYYLKPSYHLIYLPCLLFFLAWTIHQSSLPGRTAWGVTCAFVCLQLLFFWGPWKEAPDPLFRLTRGWLVQQDEAARKLMSQVEAMEGENTLVVYQDHPHLSLKMVYYLLGQHPLGSGDPQKDHVSLYDRFWQGEVPLEKYKRVVVIHDNTVKRME